MANTSSALFREETFETLSNIVSDRLGQILVDAALLSGGLFNTTYKLTLQNNERMILRLGPVNRYALMPWEHNLMTAESRAYELMREAGIPCSEVLCLDCTKSRIDRDFMIVRYIDGQNLCGAPLTSEQKALISEQLGRYISKMHGIRQEKFGRLSDVLAGRGRDSCYEAVMAEIEPLLSLLATDGFFTSAERERVRASVGRHRASLDLVKTPALTHGDLWDANILIKECDGEFEIAAIIDADRAFCGDIGFDLGNPWVINEAFLHGYGITREENETPDKKIRHSVYALIYFLIEAYVWHAEYNNADNAAGGKRSSLEKVAELERAAGYEYNVAYENLMIRRSVRRYKSISIPQYDLEKIVSAGLRAPSAMNRQTAMLVCVTDRALLAELSAMNAAVMGRTLTDGDPYGGPFFAAPAVILVFADKRQKNWLQDGALAMGNILNAAAALGYGSCYVNRCLEMFEPDSAAPIRARLGVPPHMNGVGCAVIGVADEAKIPPPIRDGRAVFIS